MNTHRSTWGKNVILAGLGLLLLSMTTGCAFYYNTYCKALGYSFLGCIEPPSGDKALLPEGPVLGPSGQVQTQDMVALGKMLFFEPALSEGEHVSCASCHIMPRGFADPHPASRGINGQLGGLNAPTVLNAAHQKKKRFFWNGRANSLEDQAEGPLKNPKEMGSPATLQDRINKLSAQQKYVKAFNAAFPTVGITLGNITSAIAAYERTLISRGNSPFDRWVKGEDLDPDAIRGWKVFEKHSCGLVCHTPPLFSNEEFHNLGIFHKNPLGDPDDRSEVTKNAEDDACKYKTPTLRNVELTAPYMHHGEIDDLKEVIKFYSDVPKDRSPGHCKDTLDNQFKVEEQAVPKLDDNDKEYLEAFLKSLTDPEFRKFAGGE